MSVRISALQLKDMRDKVYLPSSVSIFHGGGHRLGGQSCPSRLLPSPLNVDHYPHCKDHSQMLEMQGRTTSELPGKAVVSVLCVCIQYVLSGSIMCLLMTCVSSNDARYMLTYAEKPVSLDTFLKRLPAKVLKNGRVINVRSDIEKQIKVRG